jgi:hypothetical protein
MNVIKFPGGTTKKVSVQTSTNPTTRMVVGPMTFNCTSCGEVCQADFRKMIFKSLDFHCSGCGTFFKITNPAFAIPIKK